MSDCFDLGGLSFVCRLRLTESFDVSNGLIGTTGLERLIAQVDD